MTTTAESSPGRAQRDLESPGTALVLHGISWDAYQALRTQLDAARQRMYLTFDQGTLEIMSPSNFHEKHKKLLARCVEAMCIELGIPLSSAGSTTFGRPDLEKGLEPDECYYVQHAPQMAARFDDIELPKDPPPDLAFEMDYTHHPVNRDGIYAALGVPEIWRFNGERLRGFKRDERGDYIPIDTSLAFPFLKLQDLERHLKLALTVGDYAGILAFRDWVRQTFGPKP